MTATLLLSLLRRGWPYLTAVLAVLLAAGLVRQSLRLQLAEGERARCREQALDLVEQLRAAQTTAARLQGTTELQNQAVARWKSAAAEQSARAEQAEKAAGQVRTVTRTRVVRIQQAAVPTDCDGALRWAREQGQELARSWEAP